MYIGLAFAVKHQSLGHHAAFAYGVRDLKMANSFYLSHRPSLDGAVRQFGDDNLKMSENQGLENRPRPSLGPIQ